MITAQTDLIEVPETTFRMGADSAPHAEDGEGPSRPIKLSSYRISPTTVTVAEFATFVDATSYRSTAERLGGSQVFAGHLSDPSAHPTVFADAPWWRWVASVDWRKPYGATPAQPDLPVVHVSRLDALAYCTWLGVRLPTEAEWECAAQGQRDNPHIWNGTFPDAPAGPIGPMPAQSGAANERGLFHACGNVWEWVADRFARLHSPRPVLDPQGPLNGNRYVLKGGSYLCSPSYCARFRPSSRRGDMAEATACHTGFRVAI